MDAQQTVEQMEYLMLSLNTSLLPDEAAVSGLSSPVLDDYKKYEEFMKRVITSGNTN